MQPVVVRTLGGGADGAQVWSGRGVARSGHTTARGRSEQLVGRRAPVSGFVRFLCFLSYDTANANAGIASSDITPRSRTMSVVLPSIMMATISTGLLMTARLFVTNLARQSDAPAAQAMVLGREANGRATLVEAAN
jgi:hypothetical protein